MLRISGVDEQGEIKLWVALYIETLKKGGDTENAKMVADAGVRHIRDAFPTKYLKEMEDTE